MTRITLAFNEKQQLIYTEWERNTIRTMRIDHSIPSEYTDTHESMSVEVYPETIENTLLLTRTLIPNGKDHLD